MIAEAEALEPATTGTNETEEEDSASSQGFPKSLSLSHVSPSTRLLEKRRQMCHVQTLLDREKEEFHCRQEQFKRREQTLREKDKEFQKSLVKFNKFLRENEIKTNRALKKIEDEKTQQTSCDEEIKGLKLTFETLKCERDELMSGVSRNLKYQRYLESVQEAAPDDYPEIKDILNRFRVLQDAHQSVKTREDGYEEKIRQRSELLKNFTAESESQLLNMTNSVTILKRQLEEAQNNAVKAEKEWKTEAEKASDKRLQLGVTCLAIENILQRCTAEYGTILKHGHKLISEGQSPMVSAAEGPTFVSLNENADAIERAARAVQTLDVIACYILDYRKTISSLQQGPKKGLIT